MVSVVSICNRALSQCGARSSISSLDEKSEAARQCNLIYAETVHELLSMAFWNFARKTAVLALIKSAPGTPTNPQGALQWSPAYPSPPWLYEYAYPSDCQQMRMIVPQIQPTYIGTPIFSSTNGMSPIGYGPPVPFICASDTDSSGSDINVVLTNQYQAIAIYTRNVTDPNLYSGNFVQALVMALAAKLAMPLTGSAKLLGALYSATNDQVRQARASDGNEGLTVIDNMPDWITVRDNFIGGDPGYYVAPYGPLYGVV